MDITEKDLVEQGRQLVIARRRVWDLERQLVRSFYSSLVRSELTVARREYRRLLAERKGMVYVAQGKLL